MVSSKKGEIILYLHEVPSAMVFKFMFLLRNLFIYCLSFATLSDGDGFSLCDLQVYDRVFIVHKSHQL